LTAPESTGPTDPAECGLPARVGVVGAGVIGAAWAARWALCGVDVAVHDLSPTAVQQAETTIHAAKVAWERLGLLSPDTGVPPVVVGIRPPASREHESDPADGGACSAATTRCETAPLGQVTVTGNVGDAVDGAVLVHECVPERLETKQAVYAEIEDAAGPDAVIASSTSGIRPSELQTGMRHPERLVVAHPFNPVYLLPLVEVVAGEQTSEHAVERVMGWLTGAGMSPLRVRSEIDGFVADRLLEALWREALWLVHDGVATVAEIDDAMRLGFGLRWAQMGVFQTYATAGGEGGFRHFIEHFAPTLDLPWTKLTDVPAMTPEFIATLIAQADEQSGNQPIAGLSAARDRNLVDILLALEANDWGAGRSLAELRQRIGDWRSERR
jgi:carnitine 3-dehydrogenase